jgi:uncharacterized membrane protein YeaQ/YmgE (transglycosylase-associated protein family)
MHYNTGKKEVPLFVRSSIVTILIGIAGAFLGGFVGARMGLGTVSGFNLGSIALATGGALLLLIVYRLVKRQP